MNALLYFIVFYIIREILVGQKKEAYSDYVRKFILVIIGLTLTNFILGCFITDIVLLIIISISYIFYLVELREVRVVESINPMDDFTWDEI